MATIFTDFIDGNKHCYKIAESERYFAFLDDNPSTLGHTLVISKQETDYVFDLDSELYWGLMEYSKAIAIALKKAVPCRKVGLFIAGTSVLHAHIHLIPLWSETVDFEKKIKVDASEMKQVAQMIGQELNRLSV